MVRTLEQAGTHLLEVRRVLKGRGRGLGFDWSREPVPVRLLVVLEQSLLRALGQVHQLMNAVQAGAYPITPDLPPVPPVCPGCCQVTTWLANVGRFRCEHCGLWA